MTTKQLLFYFEPDNQCSWIVFDETGQSVQYSIQENIENFSLTTSISHAIVIVPSQDILLLTAELPPLSRQRLMQALPFALEEKCIDDVNNLHFSIGKYQKNWPVAIVSKQKMNQWLQVLKQCQITPTLMLPSIFTLPPPTEENRFGFVSENNCVIRTAEYDGFTCTTEQLQDFLQLYETPSNSPLNLYYVDSKLSTEHPSTHEHQLNKKDFLEQLFIWNKNNIGINLLQGSYQTKKKWGSSKKFWKAAGIISVAWILLLFVSNVVSYFILKNSVNQSERAILATYQHHFPNANTMVAPRERMEEKLKTLSSENNTVLHLISKIGNSLQQSSGVHFNHLDFQNHSLTLTVTADSFSHLDVFVGALKKQGLQITKNNAALSGKQTTATLVIHPGVL